MTFKVITVTVLILLLLILGFQNKDWMTFRLLFWEIHASKIVLISASAILGFFLGILFMMRSSIKKKRKLRKSAEAAQEKADPKTPS